MVNAAYFDGRTARRHEVVLDFEGGDLFVRGENIERREPWSAIVISERFGSGPRLLQFADDAYCEVREHAGLEAALRAAGLKTHGIEAWQASWKIAAVSLVLVVISALLAYRFALPVAAKVIAERLPPSVDRHLSRSTLKALDEAWLTPTKLSEPRREALMHDYERLESGDHDQVTAIEFRASEVLGANAFALPDGSMILLDDLVKLAADDDDEIIAVLAHEQGHVHYRHGLRMLLQGSVVAAAMTAWVGDISTLLALLPTVVLQTRYSREFEAQADAYAVERLQMIGIPPSKLADMLEKLMAAHAEKNGKPDDGNDFLSSHPATRDRMRRLREASPVPAANPVNTP